MEKCIRTIDGIEMVIIWGKSEAGEDAKENHEWGEEEEFLF